MPQSEPDDKTGNTRVGITLLQYQITNIGYLVLVTGVACLCEYFEIYLICSWEMRLLT